MADSEVSPSVFGGSEGDQSGVAPVQEVGIIKSTIFGVAIGLIVVCECKIPPLIRLDGYAVALIGVLTILVFRKEMGSSVWQIFERIKILKFKGLELVMAANNVRNQADSRISDLEKAVHIPSQAKKRTKAANTPPMPGGNQDLLPIVLSKLQMTVAEIVKILCPDGSVTELMEAAVRAKMNGKLSDEYYDIVCQYYAAIAIINGAALLTTTEQVARLIVIGKEIVNKIGSSATLSH
jgi:hypothetical protein